MKSAIKIALLFIIVLLIVLIWQSIDDPIRFDKSKKIRYNAAIQKLKDIRTAQLAYLAAHGKFAGDFDSLINFVKYDSIPFVRAIGSAPDTISEAEAIKLKLIKRDTLYVRTKDSLFSKNYPIDSLSIVPFTGGKHFIMAAKMLKVGSRASETVIEVPVFEAKVLNRVLLIGLNEQLRINFDDELLNLDKFPGLKVGSLETNVNNAGNWE